MNIFAFLKNDKLNSKYSDAHFIKPKSGIFMAVEVKFYESWYNCEIKISQKQVNGEHFVL